VVQPKDCLGLVLVWMRTRGPLNVLQLIFGLTYSNLSVYLRFGSRLIVETFRHNPIARVSIPSAEEIETFKVAFAEGHPLLIDCWATMGGLKLYLQTAGNVNIQERYYNGWMHDHYITSIFCFCPNGLIPIFLSLTFLDLYMTVKLPSLEISTTSWRKYMICMGQSVLLTQRLAT
jgi:hypothetical protein